MKTILVVSGIMLTIKMFIAPAINSEIDTIQKSHQGAKSALALLGK